MSKVKKVESFTNFIKEGQHPDDDINCTITDDDIFEVKMYSCVCPNCGCDSNLCDDKYGFNGMECDGGCGSVFEYEK